MSGAGENAHPGARRARPAPALADSVVAIVGLGLMGGSLALALRGRCRAVHGVDPDPAARDLARARGAVDRVTDDLGAGLADADAIVLAAPVRVILALLPQVGALARDGAVVTDLGSTKQQIAAAMDALPERLGAVAGHPMCGKEQAGMAAADPALFAGRTWALCPGARSGLAARAWVEGLIQAVGARPLELEPDRHDAAVAAISHVPYLAACALVELAEQLAPRWPELWALAASGFRDTTRLAGSDVRMMLDIVLSNGAAIAPQLRQAAAALQQLGDQIEAGADATLRQRLDAVRARRNGMTL